MKECGHARTHMDYESDTAMIGWLLIQSEWNKGISLLRGQQGKSEK